MYHFQRCLTPLGSFFLKKYFQGFVSLMVGRRRGGETNLCGSDYKGNETAAKKPTSVYSLPLLKSYETRCYKMEETSDFYMLPVYCCQTPLAIWLIIVVVPSHTRRMHKKQAIVCIENLGTSIQVCSHPQERARAVCSLHFWVSRIVIQIPPTVAWRQCVL